MDELVAMMAESSVGHPTSTSSEHPHFSLYKNARKAEANQKKRREEYLARQKEARFNYANHARNLAMNTFDEEEQKMDVETKITSKGKRRRSRYADELMLSEWLVDIPETLSSEWICMPCPMGKRSLVVASNGVTNAYSKSGCLIKQFSSYLPGGNRSSYTHYTLLDCIFSSEQSTFYCLDMIAWNDTIVADSDFDCRQFLLNSRISENENFKEVSKQFPYRFLCLPSCRCEKSLMEQLMRTEFNFELDGVLFYHAGALYRSGQSPLVCCVEDAFGLKDPAYAEENIRLFSSSDLSENTAEIDIHLKVGWLKPWMMPEILSVDVPASLMEGNFATKGTSQKFIDDYNLKHKRQPKDEVLEAAVMDCLPANAHTES